MIDIPIGGRVECADGPCGRAARVVIDYSSRQMTHLVVAENRRGGADHLVPVNQVLETTADLVRLRCTEEELASTEPFTDTRHVRIPRRHAEGIRCIQWPYVPEREEWVTVEYRHVSEGEITVHRGTRVQATNGRAGRVEGLRVDPTDGHISHLLLREGPPWRRKDVTIPVSQIGYLGEDMIRLEVDRQTVHSLSAVSGRQRRHRVWRAKHPTSNG